MTHRTKFVGFSEWGPGNHRDPNINLVEHYKKHVLNECDDSKYEENWNQHLQSKTVESYKMFAIDKSKIMKNKIVHTNGRGVYLSGTYKNILIIGRLNNNSLGISSCYIMSEESYHKKLETFKGQKCFDL
jgi:hypothetical protein